MRQADSEDGGFMGRALEKTVWNLGQKKHGMFTELRETYRWLLQRVRENQAE